MKKNQHTKNVFNGSQTFDPILKWYPIHWEPIGNPSSDRPRCYCAPLGRIRRQRSFQDIDYVVYFFDLYATPAIFSARFLSKALGSTRQHEIHRMVSIFLNRTTAIVLLPFQPLEGNEPFLQIECRVAYTRRESVITVYSFLCCKF